MPGALVHTVADYTPLGVVNVTAEIADAIRYGRAEAGAEVKNGGRYDGLTNADASVVAQHNAAVSIGRMMTGGAFLTLFYALAKAGVVRYQPYGGDDKDKDETNAAQGLGGFQFNQDAILRLATGEDTTWQDGDVIHDIGQYSPVSAIAETGARLATEYDDSDDGFVMNLLDATAKSIGDMVTDLSMMNSISTIADDIQYRGDKNTGEVAGDIAGDLAADSISGLIPGTIRQAAKVTDGTMRDTSADTVEERIWNRFRSVMPGLRQTLPAKVDYRGEEREYADNGLTRGLNTFLLPGDVTIYQQDDVVDYIDQIGEATGKSLYASAYAPRSLENEGEKYTLTTDDRRAYNEAYKSAYYNALGELKNSAYADKLTEENASSIAASLRSLAADEAKRAYFEANGIEYSSDYDKYQSIDDPMLYLAMKETLKDLRDSNGTDNEAFMAVYDQWKGLSREEREKYTDGVDGEFDGIDTLKKLDACLRGGLSTEQFYEVKAQYADINNRDGLNAYDRQAEFSYWLDTKSGLTSAQKRTAQDNFTFYSNIPVEESGYDRLSEAGVSDRSSMTIYDTIQALEPAAGYTNVADWQKCEAIVSGSLGLSEEEQLAAISVYASEAAYGYYQAAYDVGIPPKYWAQVQEKLRESGSTSVSQSALLKAMDEVGCSRSQMESMYYTYAESRNWKNSFYAACNAVN